MEDFYKNEGKRQVSSFYHLLSMFLICLANIKSGYIILDGLDELNEDTLSDLSESLKMWLNGAATAEIRLLLTSQPDEKIREALETLVNVTKKKEECYYYGNKRFTYQITTASSCISIRRYVENCVRSSEFLQAAVASGSVKEYFRQAIQSKSSEDRLLTVESFLDSSISLAAAVATYISLDDLQQTFCDITDRGGCAPDDVDKMVPLLSQVSLPL